MSNKRQRSEVWEHFDKTPDGKRAICNYCGKSLRASSTNGTSHLKRHPCIKNLTGDVGQLVTLESNHEARNIGLTGDAIWKYEVEKAIRTDILFASSDYKKIWSNLTGLMDIEKEIRTYYELEKEKLAIQLKNLTSRVSFSFQTVKELGYISITAHFINGDFNLMRRLIGFKKLDDLQSESCVVDATESCISDWNLGAKIFFKELLDDLQSRLCVVDAIKSCISDWNLGDKIFTFIGGDNSDDMKERLKDCSSKLLLNGKYINYGCRKEAVANLYSYCIGPLCYQENSNIDKLVKHVKGGPSRMATFNELAEERGLTPINIYWLNEYAGCSRDVKSEDLGHWKPTVDMFKQALTYKDVFNQYAERGLSMTVNGENSMLDNGHSSQLDNIDFSCLDTHVEVGQSPLSEPNMCSIDWKRVEKAVLFSDLFLKVVHGLSTSNYPTSNLYFPNLVQMEDFSYNIDDSIEIEISGEKETYHLSETFGYNLYDDKSRDLFEIANVLDPRYKLIFVEYYWKAKNDPDNFNIDVLREPCEEIFCTYANGEMNKGSSECIENTNAQEQGSPSNSPHIISGKLAKFYEHVKEIKKTRKSELYKYWGDELVDLDDASFNILSWWKQNRSKYPVLSRMARDLLAVPTCVHSIEDIISSDFKLLESANPQLVEAVICSKDWILSDVQRVQETRN